MSLHKFSNDNTRLFPVEKTSFWAEGVLEVKHIQEALAADIEILEQGLMVIAREYNKWAGSQKAIDILAIDRDGTLVVIELKRGNNDKYVDLQAIRYAGMVSVMSREDIVSTYKEYAKLGSESEAEEAVSVFLGGDRLDEYSLGENVRIFLVAEEFADEVIATVLWLNTQGLDISCYTLSPYKFRDELLLFAQRLIPLREASEWQGKFAQKKQEVKKRITTKDYTKYTVRCGENEYSSLPKSRTMLRIATFLIEQRGVSVEELTRLIGDRTHVDLFLEVKLGEDGSIVQGIKGYLNGRYFVNADEVIQSDGCTFVLSNQWGGESFFRALKDLKNSYGTFFECIESN